MKNSTKKLFVSSLALAFAAATTISTSYAWFTMQTTATVSNIELNVTSGEGFEISFGNDRTDFNAYKQKLDISDLALKYPNYTKVQLDHLTSNKGEELKNLENKSVLYSIGTEDVNKFFEFQINFRGKKEYNIYLTTVGTYGWSAGKAIPANSVLSSTESNRFVAPVADLANYLTKTPSANVATNSPIYAFAADAARLSIQDKEATGYETKVIKFATTGHEYGDAVATPNLALNYYNSIVVESPLTFPTETGEVPAPARHYTDAYFTANPLTKLVKGADDYYYASITVRVWLEGWDADCFNAILNDPLNFGLSFQGTAA